MVIFLFGFTAATAVLSIIGLTRVTSFGMKYDKLRCSIFLLLNEALYGASDTYTPGSTWKGAQGVMKEANDSIEEIREVDFSKFDDKDMGSKTFINAENVLESIGNEFKSDLTSSMKIKDPTNPSNKVIILPFVKMDDPEDGLLRFLYGEIKLFSTTVYDALGEVRKGASELGTNEKKEGILKGATDGLDTLKDFIDQIEDYKGGIYDTTDIIVTPLKFVDLGFTIYYSAMMGLFSLAAVAVFIPICCKGLRCLRFFDHLSCVFMTFFMMIGFLLSTVLMPISVLLIETCDMIELEKLKEDKSIIPDEIWDEVSVCLTGDGDIFTKKGLDKELEFANQTVPGFNILDEYYDNSSKTMKYPVYEDFKQYLKNISNYEPQRMSMEASESAILGDVTGSKNCRNDAIVWNETDCPDDKKLLTTLASEGSGCFPINSFRDTANAVTDRYGTCITPDSSITTKIQNLVEYALDAKDIIDSLISRLERKTPSTTLDTYCNAMDSDVKDAKITTTIEDLNELLETSNDIVDLLENLSGTMKESLNCTFMAGGFNKIHNSLCDNFVYDFAFITIIIASISSMTFLFIINLICLNRKTGHPKKKKKISPKPQEE